MKPAPESTHLIWGDTDSTLPVAHGRATHLALPGSHLTILKDVGHLSHIQAPDAVVEAIDTSLTNTHRPPKVPMPENETIPVSDNGADPTSLTVDPTLSPAAGRPDTAARQHRRQHSPPTR